MKAVFFDLDGTLFDTLPDIRKAMNYALKAYDGEEASLDEVRRYVGRGLHRALSIAASEKKLYELSASNDDIIVSEFLPDNTSYIK